MKISEVIPQYGCSWVITACDCRGTGKENGKLHELESNDDAQTWHCPNCKRTTAEMFGMVKVKATVISEKWSNETLAEIKDAVGSKKPSKLKGRKLEPKYKEPVSGKTWAGRGRLPKWVVGDKEQFKI